MSTRTSPGAYRDPNKIRGKALMQAEIACLSNAGVPRSLTEIVTLGRTHKRRDGDILAYFDHPHTSNGPTGAINGRLEHLRRSTLGLVEPHQLHHPSTPQNRRIQTPTTPPIIKSRFAHMLITCKRSVRCWSLLLVIVNFFGSCRFRNFARCFEKLRIGVQCII